MIDVEAKQIRLEVNGDIRNVTIGFRFRSAREKNETKNTSRTASSRSAAKG